MTRLPASAMAPVVRSALRTPVHDRRFWIVQAMVVGLAAAHLAIDMVSATPTATSAAAAVRASRSR